jgi:hypothetical protein
VSKRRRRAVPRVAPPTRVARRDPKPDNVEVDDAVRQWRVTPEGGVDAAASEREVEELGRWRARYAAAERVSRATDQAAAARERDLLLGEVVKLRRAVAVLRRAIAVLTGIEPTP